MDTSPHIALIAPPWAVMWVLAIAIYSILKGLVFCIADRQDIPVWRQAAFLFAWPGMDSNSFMVETCGLDQRPTAIEFLFAVAKLFIGLAMLLGAVPKAVTFNDNLLGWIGMIGIALSLHFGLFHLLSCIWRSCGICATAIMNWPICAVSLSDFWGRRWNLAFRDLTYQFIYRPLSRRIGTRLSLMVGFLASGLVHDFVISVPAQDGYGGPTCYFVLQGLGIGFEKSSFGRAIGLGRGVRGRLFCAATVLLPSGYLFHPAFISRVIIPFLTCR
ncbi:MBOAT family protein [Schlesneria paludicola]|uniref:MBOAT family protein n=1 Tax=Schlesneria paludicola TaxID=360056 RepID=UPI00029A068B|nr:MBOAT family protein [Schlesneria paludicola]